MKKKKNHGKKCINFILHINKKLLFNIKNSHDLSSRSRSQSRRIFLAAPAPYFKVASPAPDFFLKRLRLQGSKNIRLRRKGTIGIISPTSLPFKTLITPVCMH